ncbi:MAG: methyltransferase domain-containing protein [Gammaproteobacteria bacterium]|nr:methyltransferase domain-containing protein [Gammaproteobacteria bacterium]
MKLVPATNLSCPLDGLPLKQSDRQYQCSTGHSFDVARQGYLNLLPVQHKASKNPGDSKEMVASRTEFLNLGFYTPVAEKLNELVAMILDAEDSASICILDAGCGDGYYLDHLQKRLLENNGERELSCIGLDISKYAIQAATRRNRNTSWLVASNKEIPVLPESVDIIICMFGFPVYHSFQRVLKQNGKIIQFDTGPEHLLELRKQLYPEVREAKPFTLSDTDKNSFVIEQEGSMKFDIELESNEQIMHLLGMTPHFYRAPRNGIERVMKLNTIVDKVDVEYRLIKAL